ncbi:T-lymphocyte activation antigen CD86 isoform X1 [Xenopus laevis]|uniref:T-lymphocyte activation antigen CD86 isoform X1 n=2 Tax=Xenopus laevis TaxID=8355 RepID=A0A1L8H5I5_XENLA|nr:T-lymphocyte activation antigen CD86 isoform X1 [Xenopus laevis]XP_041439421.1 T-lymphocyte activation antigen CD86 isoform X1 [Xenopus laevis]XP_041439422.1 T-lymphocyte activation antigen CD86 isoform X1 [Xenopus laevis]OCT91338.1 hypothetical protein XELAEV_18014389mg [Xenopus laevis]
MMRPVHIFLYLIFLTSCTQGMTESSGRGKVLYGGTAKLMCSPSTNLSLRKATFHWQKQRNEAEPVFDMNDGFEESRHVGEKYKNRTKNENWDLYLYNVTIEDEGQYECYITIKQPWRKHVHKCSFYLKVIANFTPTESHSPPIHNMTQGENQTLECSLAGGYPKPRGLMWTVFNSSGTFTMKENGTIFEDAQTRLYNISSRLFVLIDGNTTISCVILQGDQNSDIYNFNIIVVPENISTTVPPVVLRPFMEVSLCITTGLVIIILMVTILVKFLKKKRRRTCCTDACKCHTPVRQAEENTEETLHQEEAMELVNEGHQNGS